MLRTWWQVMAYAALDPALRAIPERGRRLLDRRPLLASLIEHGGRAALLRQAAAEGLRDEWLDDAENAPAGEERLVGEVMAAHRAMKAAQPAAAPPYQPGAGWKRMLDEVWAARNRQIDAGDVPDVARFLRNFFRNEGISGFWGGDRMFDRFVAATAPERLTRLDGTLRHLRTWRRDLPEADTAELDTPRVGNPWGFNIDGHLVVEPMPEYHLQATMLRQLANGPATFLEIGGGFGGLAWQLLRGHPEVRYIGFDLPENITIQSYFLRAALPERRVRVYRDGLERVDDWDGYDVILLPNFMMPRLAVPVDVVVNVRSFSEMPEPTIAEYFAQIDRLAARYVFHENIYRDRGDGLYGVPSVRFPPFRRYRPLWSNLSRWPRYSRHGYPCREHLFAGSGAP